MRSRLGLLVVTLCGVATEACVRVAFMGDSLTQGRGVDDEDEDAYPWQTADRLGSGWCVGNFGSSGATALDGVASYRDRGKYGDALEGDNDAIVITLGTNDAQYKYDMSRAEFEGDYADLLDDVVSNQPGLEVLFFGIPPPLRDDESDQFNRDLLHGPLHDYIRNVAAWFRNTYDISVREIDFFSALGGEDSDSGDFADRVHLNEEGYGKMADAAADALRAWRDGDEEDEDEAEDEDEEEPVSTPQPTRDPTRPPTRPPTYAPSYRPSYQPSDAATPEPTDATSQDDDASYSYSYSYDCEDSTSWFYKKPKKTCAKYVAKKSKRCKSKFASPSGETSSEACPDTCGTC